ncbi:hypothetical protein ACYTSC_30280 [Pseudomonas aeruginosa]
MTTPIVQSISDEQLAELEEYCHKRAFVCCGNFKSGAEYMSAREEVCCNEPVLTDVNINTPAEEILGLIARLRAAEADAKRWREQFDCMQLQRDHHRDRADAALAKLAELEKQEPVAYVLFRDGEVYYETDDNIVISNTPGDETDLYRWLPVFTAPVAQAQQLHDLDKQCRDDVARALGLRPSQERGFAWSYLLASIKSCVKASEDAAQAQHSVPGNAAALVRAEAKKYSLNAAGMLDSGAPEHAQTFAIVQLLSEFDDEEAESHWEAIMAYSDFRTSDALFRAAELLAAAPGKEEV